MCRDDHEEGNLGGRRVGAGSRGIRPSTCVPLAASVWRPPPFSMAGSLKEGLPPQHPAFSVSPHSALRVTKPEAFGEKGYFVLLCGCGDEETKHQRPLQPEGTVRRRKPRPEAGGGGR